MDRFETAEQALQKLNIDYRTNCPLAAYTSFKIGGPGKIVVFPKTETEIAQVLSVCRQRELPHLILGNGSNVLVSDAGYEGIVLVLSRGFSEIRLLGDSTIYASAGVSLMKLCRFAEEHGLSGLTFAYGIPATVGGAVYMNAGAYGGEMKDVLRSVRHLNPDGTINELAAEKLSLSYRHSIYHEMDSCILSAVFELQKGDRAEIKAQMDEILNKRKEKQPLEYPSAGSTFKRPPNAFAAKLIEDCGLKGLTVGGAQVSQKHSGFIINTGNATCSDVLELIRQVREEVEKQTGILLECEVKQVG